MKTDFFLDTNVLIYAALGKGEEEAKRRRANELIASIEFGVSTQVLQEFYRVAVEKSALPLRPAVALEWVELLAEQPCVVMDQSLIRLAVEKSQRYRIGYWDAALLTAAQALGATTMYTEDLNHGQMYGSVRVVNPFRETPQ